MAKMGRPRKHAKLTPSGRRLQAFQEKHGLDNEFMAAALGVGKAFLEHAKYVGYRAKLKAPRTYENLVLGLAYFAEHPDEMKDRVAAHVRKKTERRIARARAAGKEKLARVK